jgi:NAD(P)-dependent dehydrogenase (short-subunit alcohol dehydrogenase family)
MLEHTPAELWDSVFSVNARQCFYVIQVAAPYLRRSAGSSMTFVSSVGGLLSAPRVALYGAAKAALSSLVRSAAIELGPDIRVNCVAPANTLTPRLAASLGEGDEAIFAATHPVGRMGKPEDQAAGILFLASGLASFITGQTLVVDGGLLLQMNNPDGRWPGER